MKLNTIRNENKTRENPTNIWISRGGQTNITHPCYPFFIKYLHFNIWISWPGSQRTNTRIRKNTDLFAQWITKCLRLGSRGTTELKQWYCRGIDEKQFVDPWKIEHAMFDMVIGLGKTVICIHRNLCGYFFRREKVSSRWKSILNEGKTLRFKLKEKYVHFTQPCEFFQTKYMTTRCGVFSHCI